MKKPNVIYIVFALLLLNACYSGGDYAPTEVAEVDARLAYAPPVSDAPAEVTIDRKVIRQGNMRFETKSVSETYRTITEMVAGMGGYVSSDHIYHMDDRVSHRLEVRVPAGQFDELIERISAGAKKLDNKNITARDVTEEFIDVEARLKTNKELEGRYLTLLQRANTVDEILKIERQIGILRAEIESIEGRLRYLNDRISLSTLSIEFYEMTGVSFGFSSKFANAFINGWDNLLHFIIGLTNLWAFIILLAVGIIALKRYRKRKIKSPKPQG